MEDAMASAVHISLNVSDLSRAVAFYRGLFGEPKKLQADYAKFVAEDPEIHLALQPGRQDPSPRPSPAGRGGRVTGEGALSHLGIRVESSEKVRQWKTALTERGLAAEEVEREACCYAVQDKFWVTDPDGNRWEVYTVLEDIEQKAEPATACCQPNSATPTACC